MHLILDTHTLVWFMNGIDDLGRDSRQLIETSSESDVVAVSAITFWELAMLQQRNRLELPLPIAEWRQRVLDHGVMEIPVTGEIGISAVSLADFHSDPADRIITATALIHSAQLVTADTAILAWSGDLDRHNAAL